MASLNPEASEFVPGRSFTVPYINNPCNLVPSGSFTYYPYFSTFQIMETPYFMNFNTGYLGLEWYPNTPPSPPMLPYGTYVGPLYVAPPNVNVASAEQEIQGVADGRSATNGDMQRNYSFVSRKIKKIGNANTANGPDFGPIKRDDTRTTIMIKNIPNRYTREMLVKSLDHHCLQENSKPSTKSEQDEDFFPSEYDFVYLPIDFWTRSNMGYAFVNFTNPRAAWKFSLSWHNKKWEFFNSMKICKITYASIQGKEALVKHFECSRFACEQEEFLPVYFNPYRDGSSGTVEQCTVGKCIGR